MKKFHVWQAAYLYDSIYDSIIQIPYTYDKPPLITSSIRRPRPRKRKRASQLTAHLYGYNVRKPPPTSYKHLAHEESSRWTVPTDTLFARRDRFILYPVPYLHQWRTDLVSIRCFKLELRADN